MPKAAAFTATTFDMAILLDAQLSENQGVTPEGYLICQNVPVSRTGVQFYYGSEMGLTDRANERIPVYRLPEDVFAEESLRSLESKPITDDHPSQMVTVENAGFLTMGHGRNARHNNKNVIADLVVMSRELIAGIREKRKYEISLGYTCNYVPYKDGFKQTNIRINHIAVVETGRAGRNVAIKDKMPVSIKNRRSKSMDKNQAIATMFAAFAKDASPEEVAEMLPFVTDAAPAAPAKPAAEPEKKDSGLIALLTGLMAKDAKPAEKPEPLTAEAVQKMITDGIAAALKPATKTKDKKAKDEDEKEVEQLLEDEESEEKETEDSETEEEKETADEGEEEEAKEAKDAVFANVIKALQPLYKQLPASERKKLVKDVAAVKKKPTADGYAKILEAVQTHTKDAEPARQSHPDTISKQVMANRNPHYKK